jgi:hypothetical protein
MRKPLPATKHPSDPNADGEECDAAEFGHNIGQFLASILFEARAELGPEDPTTDEFGWPNYEGRGKENLV